MPSTDRTLVFREPSGRLTAAVMLLGSVFLSSGFVYYGILHDTNAVHLLVMAAGFALSGVAESLPTRRRRAAGVLRIGAIALLLGLLIVTILAPDVVL